MVTIARARSGAVAGVSDGDEPSDERQRDDGNDEPGHRHDPRIQNRTASFPSAGAYLSRVRTHVVPLPPAIGSIAAREVV